jgi:hypothetical protein
MDSAKSAADMFQRITHGMRIAWSLQQVVQRASVNQSLTLAMNTRIPLRGRFLVELIDRASGSHAQRVVKETLGERTALHSCCGQPRLELITEEATTTTGGDSCSSVIAVLRPIAIAGVVVVVAAGRRWEILSIWIGKLTGSQKIDRGMLRFCPGWSSSQPRSAALCLRWRFTLGGLRLRTLQRSTDERQLAECPHRVRRP